MITGIVSVIECIPLHFSNTRKMKQRSTPSALLFTLSCIVIMAFRPAHDICENLLFFKEGATTTMTSYDKDNKVTGSSKSVYSSVKTTAEGSTVIVAQESFDKKGKSVMKHDFTIRCKAGVIYFDMKMAMPSNGMNNGDFQMKIDGNDLEFPGHLTVGATLKDSHMKCTFSGKDNTPIPMMTVEVDITNRKVEALETITTPAGTFECYRISEDYSAKSIVPIHGKNKQWFNYEVGTVRTESYRENGNLSGSTVLTEMKK